MTRLNFKEFTVFTGIGRKGGRTADVREEFADVIYTRVNGIRAHALAMKIYKSDGAEEYTEEEARLIRGMAERYCTPAFIDGLREQIAGCGRPEAKEEA